MTRNQTTTELSSVCDSGTVFNSFPYLHNNNNNNNIHKINNQHLKTYSVNDKRFY